MRPASTRNRQPTVDLAISVDGADAGRAELWLPELLMRGHSDEGRLWARGAVDWRGGETWAHEGRRLSYSHANTDGSLELAADVAEIEWGWSLSLTVGNPTAESWNDVIACVCLQLPALPVFADPDWRRTYYCAGGRHLSYAEAVCDGGLDPYRMSMVGGRQQIHRTQRHRDKWGFTRVPSDDGIIAVMGTGTDVVLSTTWESVHHLQANRTPSFCCIHANPFFGDLEPGKHRTLHGSVLLTHGGLNAAWEAARAAAGGGPP